MIEVRPDQDGEISQEGCDDHAERGEPLHSGGSWRRRRWGGPMARSRLGHALDGGRRASPGDVGPRGERVRGRGKLEKCDSSNA